MLRVSFFLLLGLGSHALAQVSQTRTNNWRFLGATSVARTGACAVQLIDGRLLLAGGGPPGASRALDIMDSAGDFVQASTLEEGHARHSCAVLPGGSVLITGGTNATRVMDEAAIYNPAANEWAAASRMNAARMGHTSTVLPDGRILIAGGENASGVLDSLEIFDPATSRFTPLGAMSSQRRDHAAALLPDGRVLIAGGSNESGVLATADLFDPSTGAARLHGRLSSARSGLSATALPDGTVLLAGGTNGFTALPNAEIYDPVTGSMVDAPAMTKARSGHFAFLSSSSGDVLLIGGDGATGTAELFQFTSSKSTGSARSADQSQPVFATADGVVVRSAPGTGSGTLDQCANGPLGANGEFGSACAEWVNGNLNGSKASYREGDSVPYRLRMSGMTTGKPSTVTIEWDTTQSGKHALDYLTAFNASVKFADPCLGGACSGLPSGDFQVPIDLNINDTGSQPGSMVSGRYSVYSNQTVGQKFYLWGGTISSISSPSRSGTYASSSSTSVVVTFVPTSANPVLAWGGHIATRVDWGAAYSAVTISGSPFHMRLNDVNGSGGNQDRSLSNDAAVFASSIKIKKNTNGVGALADAFTFSTGANPIPDGNPSVLVSSFKLPVDVNGSLSYERLFDDIYVRTGTQTFVISESGMPANWVLSSISCVKLAGTGSVTSDNTSATINVQEGDSFECTFTNTAPVKIRLTKSCVNPIANDTFALSIGADSESRKCGEFMERDLPTTAANVTVAEAARTEYSTSISCTTSDGNWSAGGTDPATSLTFSMPSPARSILCTVTNKRNSYKLTLSKACVPADGGKFNLTAAGQTATDQLCGTGKVETTVLGGTANVTISEADGTGTSLTNYDTEFSCTGVTPSGSGLSRSFTMPDNDVSCTVTNRRKSNKVTLTKVCVPAKDTGKFNLTIGDLTGENKSCGESIEKPVPAGSLITVSESNGTSSLSNYTTVIACDGVTLTGSDLSKSFTMPVGAVNCTVTNTRKSYKVTLTKACVPTTDSGKFNLTINSSTTADKKCNEFVETTVIGGTSVSISEAPGTDTSLANYSTGFACGTTSLTGTGTERSFTMPDGPVDCTVTNTRNSYTVRLTKVCAPVDDPGKFNLTIDGTTTADKSCGQYVEKSIVGGTIIKISEAAGTGTNLGDYSTAFACGTLSLTGSAYEKSFTMPDVVGGVQCTVTNTRPSITVTKTCSAGLNASMSVTVSSSGKVCNTGDLPVSILTIVDVQTGAGANATGVVTFDSSTPLAGKSCRDYTSTFNPTAVSSGSCAAGDSTCTATFTDKITVTGEVSGVTNKLKAESSADCKLCKP